MKIVLFGATGMVGQRIAREALSRGHTVTGVVRDAAAVTSLDERMSLVKGDATDVASISAIVQGADAVVTAISPRPNARGLAAPSLATSAHALIAGLPAGGVTRLLIVGGAGSLEVAPGVMAMDTPTFPEE
jgi:putative NADH-flavin reductase